MSGRRMKELSEDGRPRTAFVRSLRRLREDQGNPPYRVMADAIGYSQADFSALFNVDRLPSPELLADAVAWLKGDPDLWLKRLAELQEEERRLAAISRGETDPQARIEELAAEVERLTMLVELPLTSSKTAASLMAEASARITNAEELERGVRALLQTLEEQTRRSRESVVLAEEQARAVRIEAERQAERLAESIEYQRETIISEAEATAAGILRSQREEAAEDRRKSQIERDALRANAFAMVDQLIVAAEEQLASAREQAAEIVARARLERARAEEDAGRAADRFTPQARFEMQRVIREVQQRLEAVGDQRAAAEFDTLLIDFNIGGSHGAAELGGRHRRQILPAAARAELPRAGA